MGKHRVRGRKRPNRLGDKGTPITLPITYERRLASYGLRNPVTGEMIRQQTGPQRRRIRHKLGHVNRRAA